MSIPRNFPGYKYFKDKNGHVYALRDYWYTQKDTRDYLSICVKNDAVDGEWYDYAEINYYGYGNKYMTRKAEEKAQGLNERDHCILSIPCTASKPCETSKPREVI